MARNRVPLLRLLGLTVVLGGLPFLVPSPGAASPAASLVVTPSGGEIVSSDRRIDCGSRCSARYRTGTIVRLVAFDTHDFTFQSWQSGCVGELRSCFVQVAGGAPVRARYVRKTDLLQLTVGGPGVVRSSPPGIACGPGDRPSSCEAQFGRDTTVVLTEEPSRGDIFDGWNGPCEGKATRCAVQMSADRSATAGFGEAAPSPAGAIAVKVASVKPQRVVSVPAGIDCHSACTETFPAGTPVTLHAAVPFGRWSGACRGSVPTCPVVAGAPLVVLASAPIPHPLTPPPTTGPGTFGINVSVSGRGVVVGGGRINCGKRTNTIRACGGYFNVGQTVLLRATPARGSRFAGWSGGFCAGTGPCSLLVDANKVVYATFGP